MSRYRLIVALVAVALAGGSLSIGGFAAQSADCGGEWPSDTVQIMAPAAPGGGWDTTAREMQQVLDAEVLEESVEVFNVEGAGGTVGLAQLVNELADDESTMMMMGLVMVGAIALNQAEVSLDDVTPIARLTTEYEVVVVPADSEFQTLDDLVAAFQADPASISWAGGSAGGTDHILVGLIAQAVEVDPTQINYVAFSGGGEALAAILGSQVSAGVSGVGEWQSQIESGELRALAVSSGAADTATPEADASASPAAGGLDIPTLQEQGVDVALANWRGLVAPPEISDEVRACMIATVEEMVGTEAWSEVLNQYGWEDFFLPGDEYGAFLTEERERVIGILTELELIES